MKTILKYFQSWKNTQRTLVAVEDNHAPKDDIFRVEWNLGRRCNYDCSYCSPSIHDKASEHIDLKVVEKTLDKIVAHGRSQDKAVRISLTGGEPYLHPNFIELLAMIKDKGVKKIAITSNASIPSRTYIKSLEYIDYLILSIHFEFTKVEKLEEKIKKIHSHLDANQNLHLHIMAIPSKVTEAVEFAQKMDELGVSYALRRVRPQFNSEGLYLQPFNSGQKGTHTPDWEKIRESNQEYYSKKELEMLGAQ